MNAPCSQIAPSLTASPNPIPVTGSAIVGMTTLSWNAPGVQQIEIHIGSPDDKLFTAMGSRGALSTGVWVADGMTFYLQDVTGGQSLTSDYTLATLVIHLQSAGSAGLSFPRGPRLWAGSASTILLGFALCWALPRRHGPRIRGVPAILGVAILLVAVASFA